MKKYETTFIVDSLIKNEEIEGIITKIEKFISNNGGQIDVVARWGKKRLAYEIKKRQYGYYVHIVFDAHNKLNRLLDREYQLDENILRYLTLLVDPHSENAKTIQSEKEFADKSEPVTETDIEEQPVETEEEPESDVVAEETEESSAESAS